MARENRKRWLELDALRAFAVLLVVWSHSSNREIGIGGFDGVLLFFVISGFLITGILLQARVAAPWPFVLRAFYARRFLRIFPVYYALVFIAAGLGIPYVREALGWHLAYLSIELVLRLPRSARQSDAPLVARRGRTVLSLLALVGVAAPRGCTSLGTGNHDHDRTGFAVSAGQRRA
jgi:hypothetical protein